MEKGDVIIINNTVLMITSYNACMKTTRSRSVNPKRTVLIRTEIKLKDIKFTLHN